jgi:transposase
MQITTIGLDIAKNVFQVHGIDAAERVVRKQLRRGQVMKFFEGLPRCLVGLEACATAHYWARELTKLGHRVRLMPAKDVKAYVKRNKNDAADAEAICEAVRRPTMRFVEVKSAEQQGRLMQHRARDLLMRQRTQAINALRAHMAELGIVAAQGREGLRTLLAIIVDEKDERLPVDARAGLIVLAAQLQALQTMIGSIEKRIIAQHRASEESKRVATIPGIGTLGASAITATVTDASAFRSGRDFAAWIGLVPRQDSTGEKPRLGPISKQGDRYLRRLLVVGGIAARQAEPADLSVADAAAGAATVQGRGRCACQQDGARRLGAVGQGWHLSSACARGSVREAIRCEGEVASVRFMNCKGDDGLMRNGRDRRSENPRMCHARKERVLLFGTDQRITSGPAARTAAFRGRIHGCTRTISLKRQIFLLHRGRRPYMALRGRPRMSAQYPLSAAEDIAKIT